MVKVSMSGDGMLFSLDEVTDGLKLTFEKFQNMCIAAGCDYVKNIRGFGIKKAYHLAKTCTSDFVQALCQIKGAPENYMNDFKNAYVVFNQQTIFDMTTCKTISLHDCSDELTPNVQRLCGEYPFYGLYR
jgi:5'-3' exonuclease